MSKIIRLTMIILLFLTLLGCQNNNHNLQDNDLSQTEDVTSIQVYEWDSEEFIATIDEKDFIEELVKELDTAKTHSTQFIDWPLPEYKLLIKHDNEVLYEIGYCKDVKNFGNGAVGRYWESDKLYEVSTNLPMD